MAVCVVKCTMSFSTAVSVLLPELCMLSTDVVQEQRPTLAQHSAQQSLTPDFVVVVVYGRVVHAIQGQRAALVHHGP